MARYVFEVQNSWLYFVTSKFKSYNNYIWIEIRYNNLRQPRWEIGKITFKSQSIPYLGKYCCHYSSFATSQKIKKSPNVFSLDMYRFNPYQYANHKVTHLCVCNPNCDVIMSYESWQSYTRHVRISTFPFSSFSGTTFKASITL